ncbi:MAG: type IV pilus secretin PilQ [Elusimicrobia bacterium]|nr:type IV pilus secretin PilQ [Elusimicrobiota bacterium]
MKKTISLAITAVFLAQNPVFIFAVENAVVKSVRVSSDSVYITTDKPVKYRAFRVGQPPKLVLELDDSRLKTLAEIPVNGKFIKRVRTGQYKTSPVSVTRIVMDLTQKAVYEITQKGTELMVVFGGKRNNKTPPLKDSPAGSSASAEASADKPASTAPVKIIMPDAQEKSPAPEAKAKSADLSRERALVIAPKKTAPVFRSTAKNIMDNLSRGPISFDYSDANVREVLSMMAAKAGINMIYTADVTGSITLNLNKVPFDEAFKTVLNVQGLAAQQVGDNILRIAAPATLLAEEKKAFLQTRVFFLNYSKTAEIKTQVDSVASAEGRKSNSVIDVANNALIVTDSAMGLETTARLIRSLDRAPKQVLIEAKLIEVSLVDEFDLGVNWGYASGPDSKGRWVGTNSAGWPNTGKGGVGTGVDLAAKNIYGALRLGRFTSEYGLDLAITAAAKKGKAKVLSDPKVATLNNKEATINITSQIPYETVDTVTTGGIAVTTTKVTYITTGIVLKVTPAINSDGRISMKINPSVSQPSVTAGTTAPAVDTRSADTNVIVRNGETIVIGGLIHDAQSNTVYKVPLFGDIPLLGVLFRKKSVSRTRMELLIFVTPRIMED